MERILPTVFLSFIKYHSFLVSICYEVEIIIPVCVHLVQEGSDDSLGGITKFMNENDIMLLHNLQETV